MKLRLALCLIAVPIFIIDTYIYHIPREILAVNPKNLGAKCDGKHDDTEGFRKASEAAMIDGGIVLVPDGCYVSAIPNISGLIMQGVSLYDHFPTLHFMSESGLYLMLYEKVSRTETPQSVIPRRRGLPNLVYYTAIFV